MQIDGDNRDIKHLGQCGQRQTFGVLTVTGNCEGRAVFRKGAESGGHMPPDLPVSAPLLFHTPSPVGSLVKAGD